MEKKAMPLVEGSDLFNLLWSALWGLCQTLTVWILSLGTVPAHMCVVPDGHRTFSKATSIDLRQAYAMGNHNIILAWNWCFSAGVPLVSGFAYSVHNLSRDSFQMSAALSSAKEAFEYILDNLHEYRAMGVRAESVGDLELLPQDVHETMARAERATSSNTKKSCKVFAAYSTKHQMTLTARQLAKAVKEGVLCSQDITRELQEDLINLTGCPDVQLLLRTAGNRRFSDFLVLQSGYAYFHVESMNFPELGFREWAAAMLQFQLRLPRIQAVKMRHGQLVDSSSPLLDAQEVMREQTFLRRLCAARSSYVERLAGVQNAAPRR